MVVSGPTDDPPKKLPERGNTLSAAELVLICRVGSLSVDIALALSNLTIELPTGVFSFFEHPENGVSKMVIDLLIVHLSDLVVLPCDVFSLLTPS